MSSILFDKARWKLMVMSNVTNSDKQKLTGAENKAAKSMLFDYYGQLLNERQNEIFRLYYEEDYSLSEVATELDISRQGVHDALKKAEATLVSFEEKLKLIAKHEEYLDALKKINEIITSLISEEDALTEIYKTSDGKKISELLSKMQKTVGNLDI